MQFNNLYPQQSPQGAFAPQQASQLAAQQNYLRGGQQQQQGVGGFQSLYGQGQQGVGGIGGVGQNFLGTGGSALQAGKLALGGLQTIGSLFSSFQQQKLANKSLNLQERTFDTNLANTTQQYNTSLEGRIKARYAAEGRPEQAAAQIERDRL